MCIYSANYSLSWNGWDDHWLEAEKEYNQDDLCLKNKVNRPQMKMAVNFC